jgi:glycosyltransferase involved in cell wall biosynthesis
MDKPLVSVVIPTFNSEKTIGKCLESIKNQTYKNVEIIVVDKNSNDKTVEIAKRYGVRVIKGNYNKPQARNIGILNAKGEIVFLSDSDFVLEKELIKEAVEVFRKNKCDAIFVPEEFEEKNFISSCKNLEKIIYKGNKIIESPRIYKRWVFDEVIFDEKNEGPDEYDFYISAKKIGIKEACINSKIILIEPYINLKKKFNHGRYFSYYEKKHSKDKIVKNQVSFAYRMSLLIKSFKLSFVKTLGLVFIKTLEYSAFMLGRFFGKFDRKIQRLNMNIREEFDIIGENYGEMMYAGTLGNIFVDKMEKKEVFEVIEKLNLKEKSSILEIGAGSGRWTSEFIKLNYKVTALDISKSMCVYLGKKFKSIEIVCGDIESVKLKRKYDVIFSFRSFKYVLNIDDAIENIKSNLKPKGFIIVEMPNKNNFFYFLPYILSPIIYGLTGRVGKYFINSEFVTEKKFKNYLKKNGFDIILVKKLFFFPHKFYSRVNNQKMLTFMEYIDRIFSKISPRSFLFVVRMNE